MLVAGEKMVYFNTEDRTMPKGLYVGKDSKSVMLQVDEGLSSVKHYGIDSPVHRIEVNTAPKYNVGKGGDHFHCGGHFYISSHKFGF